MYLFKSIKKSVEQHDEAHLNVPLINYTCGAFPTSFSVSKARDLDFQYQITFSGQCIVFLYS